MVAVLSVAGLLIVRSYDGSAAATATAGSVSGPHAAGTSPLASLANADPQRRVEVILQLDAGADAAVARDLIRSSGGAITRELPIINGIGAKLDASDAQRLSTNPAFHAVSLNAKVESEGNDFDDRLVTSYNESIQADEAWDDDYTGKGVGVAVIDTGIQGDLPDFRESRRDTTSRVIATAVVNPGASNAADTLGHGTHVAGLIAGDDMAARRRPALRGSIRCNPLPAPFRSQTLSARGRRPARNRFPSGAARAAARAPRPAWSGGGGRSRSRSRALGQRRGAAQLVLGRAQPGHVVEEDVAAGGREPGLRRVARRDAVGAGARVDEEEVALGERRADRAHHPVVGGRAAALVVVRPRWPAARRPCRRAPAAAIAASSIATLISPGPGYAPERGSIGRCSITPLPAARASRAIASP